jgi:hypothetical protein
LLGKCGQLHVEQENSLKNAISKSREMCLRSKGDPIMKNRIILRYELKSPQKGMTTLLEASLDHLLATPPSHFIPQKVRGFVVGLIGNERGKLLLRNTLNLRMSQEENCLPNLSFFPGQHCGFRFEQLYPERKGQKRQYRKDSTFLLEACQ